MSISTIALVIAAVAAGLALLTWLGVTLISYVAHDGYGRPRASAPPRSHYAYFDDPRRVA
ncbi:MAG TPA: hypothetical protein VF426_03595 [Marmoricola sp.]